MKKLDVIQTEKDDLGNKMKEMQAGTKNMGLFGVDGLLFHSY